MDKLDHHAPSSLHQLRCSSQEALSQCSDSSAGRCRDLRPVSLKTADKGRYNRSCSRYGLRCCRYDGRDGVGPYLANGICQACKAARLVCVRHEIDLIRGKLHGVADRPCRGLIELDAEIRDLFFRIESLDCSVVYLCVASFARALPSSKASFEICCALSNRSAALLL